MLGMQVYGQDVGGSLKTCLIAAKTLLSFGTFGSASPIKRFQTSESSFCGRVSVTAAHSGILGVTGPDQVQFLDPSPTSPKQPTSMPSRVLRIASTGIIHGQVDEKPSGLKSLGIQASYQRHEYVCGFRWVRCAKGWAKRKTNVADSVILRVWAKQILLGFTLLRSS